MHLVSFFLKPSTSIKNFVAKCCLWANAVQLSSLVLPYCTTIKSFHLVGIYKLVFGIFITPVLKSLHWLPVNRRIQFKILLITFKCLHGSAPNYLIDLIQISKPTRQLRNSSKLLLQKRFVKTSAYGDRCFARAAADLWNILPEKPQQSDNTAVFKNN